MSGKFDVETCREADGFTFEQSTTQQSILSPFPRHCGRPGEARQGDFTTRLTISSGLFVHFGNRQRVYNFGDSNGVKLSLKNGKDVVIFSNEVFERRGEIEKMLA